MFLKKSNHNYDFIVTFYFTALQNYSINNYNWFFKSFVFVSPTYYRSTQYHTYRVLYLLLVLQELNYFYISQGPKTTRVSFRMNYQSYYQLFETFKIGTSSKILD